jgi:alkanesulfonate monooxygenase SsuD/methylene tetrahydromethanopterin reductase-like flavin-dependent oxidoreductase (luciferase family)
MREDRGMTQKAKEKELIEGLNPGVGFTKLTLSAAGHRTQFTVVGTPEQIIEKFNQ